MNYMSKPAQKEMDWDNWNGFFSETDVLTEDDLLRSPGRSYLVPGFLPSHGLTVAFGPPKEGGKTSFWLRLARRLSQGLPIFGHPSEHPRGVIYVTTEGEHSIRDRVAALRLVEGPAPDLRIITRQLDMFDQRTVEQLADAAEAAHLVIIDTLGRLMGSMGADENGADMARIISAFDTLREQASLQIVLLHHPALASGASRPRGNSALTGAADTIIEHAMLADGSRTATVKQARDEAAGLVRRYRLRPVILPAEGWTLPRSAVCAEDMDCPPSPLAPAAPAKRPRRGA